MDDKQHEAALRNGRPIEVELPQVMLEKGTSVKNESRDSSPVEAKAKSIEKVQGIPTPTSSPKMPSRTALPVAKSKTSQKQSRLAFPAQDTKESNDITSRAANKQAKQAKQPKQPKETNQPKKAAPRKPKQTKKAAPPNRITPSTTYSSRQSR